MRFPLPVVALVCVALMFASFGCRGGGGGEAASGASPEQWSAAICNAVVDLQHDVQERSIKLQQQLRNVASIAEARQRLVDFLDAWITRNDQALAQLEAAGNPAVENGDEIGQTLRTELARTKPALQDARNKAAALPDDPQAFARDVEEIGTDLAATSGELGRRLDATLGQIDTPELAQAFHDDPACQGLHLTD